MFHRDRVENGYIKYLLDNLLWALIQTPGEEHQKAPQEHEENRAHETLCHTRPYGSYPLRRREYAASNAAFSSERVFRELVTTLASSRGNEISIRAPDATNSAFALRTTREEKCDFMDRLPSSLSESARLAVPGRHLNQTLADSACSPFPQSSRVSTSSNSISKVKSEFGGIAPTLRSP